MCASASILCLPNVLGSWGLEQQLWRSSLSCPKPGLYQLVASS